MVVGDLFVFWGSPQLALAVCAWGRALDFATTWVGLELGRATEAKPVTAQLIQWLGPQSGLILYELFITTPAIFLGCRWVARLMARNGGMPAAASGRGTGEILLLYFIGLVSFLTAVHNCSYIF